jgi:hypothetical protein
VSDEAAHDGIQLNQASLVGGSVLIGIGALLGFTGVLLFSSAIVEALRRWMRQLEPPPSEFARRRWRQARNATSAAASAGSKAWQSGGGSSP